MIGKNVIFSLHKNWRIKANKRIHATKWYKKRDISPRKTSWLPWPPGKENSSVSRPCDVALLPTSISSVYIVINVYISYIYTYMFRVGIVYLAFYFINISPSFSSDTFIEDRFTTSFLKEVDIANSAAKILLHYMHLVKILYTQIPVLTVTLLKVNCRRHGFHITSSTTQLCRRAATSQPNRLHRVSRENVSTQYITTGLTSGMYHRYVYSELNK